MTQPVLLKRFKGQCLMLLLLLTSFAASAQEAYTVFTESDSTLTFYYDELRSTRPGTPYDLNTGNHDPDWRRKSPIITQVVFDPSFAAARPTTTHSWFNQMNRLVSIIGINYLKTDSVTDMGLMFQGCESLTTLDVSGFNTSSVTNMQNMFRSCKSLERIDLSSFNTEKVRDMYGMFAYCESLTSLDLSHFDTRSVRRMERMFYFSNHLETIYAGYDWSTDSLSGSTSSNHMFMGCTCLVGGQGTVYDAKYVDATYAHIDGGPSYPGYLSAKGLSADAVAYAVLSTDETTLTFYCDELSSNRSGTSYPLNTGDENPDWHEKIGKVSRVVFNPSFATVRPTSTHSWFCGMSDLVSITGIQYLNTSLVTDMAYMFFGCNSMTSLDLRSFNTENVKDMYNMFYECFSLTSLDLRGFNTEDVTKMHGMFNYCESLSSLDLSSFNTANVEDMTMMFHGCSNLEAIYAGNGWSTGSVAHSSSMFTACTHLVGGQGTTYDGNHVDATRAHIDEGPSNPGYLSAKSATATDNAYVVLSLDELTLTFYCDSLHHPHQGTYYSLNTVNNDPGWYDKRGKIVQVVFDPSFAAARPTTTHNWFNQMKRLVSITGINYLKTDSVTDMGLMFQGCESLTTLDVSGFNTSSVTNMLGMFSGCTALTNLDVSGFNTQHVSDMEAMFSGCKLLTTLDVSSFNTSNVTDISSMFQSCCALTSLDVSGFNTEHVTNMEKMFYDCELLTNLDVSGFNTSNVTNMESMFWYCSSVTSLDVSGFNTDNVTKMYRMFCGCQSLTSLDVGNFNTGNVISMESMFCDCESLVSLDLSGFNTSNVKNMERMFWDCSSLTSLDLSGFNTEKVTNMEDMFCDCASLTSLDVSSFNTSKVTNMFGLFNGCKSLTSLDLRGFNTSSVTEMYRMFADCSSLTAIDLSSFNTENLTSTTAMFDGCISLTSLDLSSFNTSKVQFMGTMFNGCDHLETIYAGKAWTTDAVTYSNKMFYGCTRLVGGQGTTYNEHFVDAARAHIDGGPSNPGYFTEKVNVFHGDVNGDGTVNIADVNCIISVILGGPDFHEGRADVNADGSVNIADINAAIASILTGSGM